LGVILSQFPRYDEAFILRELVALAQGYELVIFSLRPCRDRVVHAQAKALVPNTVYCPFLLSGAMWRSHARFLRRNPAGYLGALGWIVSRHWAHPAILLRTLLLFPKTVHFARLAQERGVPLVHAFWATYPAACAMIIERLTGIPFGMSGHAHDIYTTNPTLREKLRAARFVVTCTEANRRHLAQVAQGRLGSREAPVRSSEFGVRRVSGERTMPLRTSNSELRTDRARSSEIFVSYHGVDLAKFSPAPKSDGAACELLAVGSLLPCKGYETLIDACRLLKSRGAAFRCTLAGGGPLERSLRRRIARQGLEGEVTITGYVSQEEVARLYQRATVFLLPLVSKIHWGIPNVLIEALATKTPVVSCALPSMAELVEHGRSGWIIPEQDPDALARAVETLWSQPALRRELAEAGYGRVAERFALAKTGERLRKIFEQWSANRETPVRSSEFGVRRVSGERPSSLRTSNFKRRTDRARSAEPTE